jgi:hypothetical protein
VWEVPAQVVDMLVTRTQALVEEAIEAYGGNRIAVSAVSADGQVMVHVIALSCGARRADTIDQATTAAVLRDVAPHTG